MANRFDYEQYRPQHGGDSAFPTRGWSKDDPYPHRPAGGAVIPRKPNPKAPSSSGGMALSLPKKEKVGLW